MQRDFRKEQRENKHAFERMMVFMQHIQAQVLALSVVQNSPLVEESNPTPFNFSFPS